MVILLKEEANGSRTKSQSSPVCVSVIFFLALIDHRFQIRQLCWIPEAVWSPLFSTADRMRGWTNYSHLMINENNNSDQAATKQTRAWLEAQFFNKRSRQYVVALAVPQLIKKHIILPAVLIISSARSCVTVSSTLKKNKKRIRLCTKTQLYSALQMIKSRELSLLPCWSRVREWAVWELVSSAPWAEHCSSRTISLSRYQESFHCLRPAIQSQNQGSRPESPAIRSRSLARWFLAIQRRSPARRSPSPGTGCPWSSAWSRPPPEQDECWGGKFHRKLFCTTCPERRTTPTWSGTYQAPEWGGGWRELVQKGGWVTLNQILIQ